MIQIAETIPICKEIEMLSQLLEEDQFELVEPEKHAWTNVGSEEFARPRTTEIAQKDFIRCPENNFASKNSASLPQADIGMKESAFHLETDIGTKESAESDEFEKRVTQNEIRLVYLMNDAVESFLIFGNSRMTGFYNPDYEGELRAYLDRNGQEYILVVYQGDNVITIFFSSIRKEVFLYNYARLGHFWVEGYEYLRQLEYHLAILRDKRDYLGEEYCSKEELELAVLTEFPPLNYCCYPAAPLQYVVPAYPEWKVSAEAFQEMDTLAKDVGDKKMLWVLRLYQMLPSKWLAVKIAGMFHKTQHARLTDYLIAKIAAASSEYPDRIFSAADDAGILHSKIENAVEERMIILMQQKKKADLVWEEPFTIARDSVEMKAHLMIWDISGTDRKVKIETVTGKNDNERYKRDVKE